MLENKFYEVLYLDPLVEFAAKEVTPAWVSIIRPWPAKYGDPITRLQGIATEGTLKRTEEKEGGRLSYSVLKR